MRDFKELKVWQKGLDIATKSFNLIASFPKEEKFGLSSQITRCAVSIPSNIAEGSGRSSDKEYARFLEQSLGSSFEIETQLLIAQAVSYGQKELISSLLSDVDQKQKYSPVL